MKILSVQFVKSVAKLNQLPEKKLPEIAFSGRSNVGKSSLINCLVNRKKLALTSSTPGKTRLLNYYSVNENIYFVDLPGYGYAKVAQSERMLWKRLIESYLTKSAELKGVVQIIDARQGITELDGEMIQWLNHLGIPVVLVATKTDKLSRSKIALLLDQLNKHFKESPDIQIVPFSAITKQGKKELWGAIGKLLNRSSVE